MNCENKNELICEDINDLKCLIQIDKKGNKYIDFKRSDVYCDFDVDLEGVDLLNANKFHIYGFLVARNIKINFVCVDNDVKANNIEVEEMSCAKLNCKKIEVLEGNLKVCEFESGELEYIKPFNPSDVCNLNDLF
jgi:hypothetical protein